MRKFMITLKTWDAPEMRWNEDSPYTEQVVRSIVKARYPNWQSLTVKQMHDPENCSECGAPFNNAEATPSGRCNECEA